MELPSKELFEKVIGYEIEFVEKLNSEKDVLYYMLSVDKTEFEINIYELMHLMKEWANKLDKQYELNSYITQQRTGAICEVYEAWHGNTAFGDFEYEGVGVTEFEVVTKACEWILSQKESK